MAIQNVNLYFTGGSATGVSAQQVQTQRIQETLARRLIARNLKIITGTMTWAASGLPGSAGEVFDYQQYGDRFLWMGFTPRVAPTAANMTCFLPMYNPSTRRIYMAGSPGSTVGTGRALVVLDKNVFASYAYTTGFCLLVTESMAGSGIGHETQWGDN